jgi:murein DD-endopeptidase MepM/ murein hydrolase activator NlpD
MQYAYEDRIAELRSQVDRLTSRQLLDQEQFEQKLEQLARRQSTLESRAGAISGMANPMPTGSVKPSARAPGESTPALGVKPSPINDTVILVLPPDREARLESRLPKAMANSFGTSKSNGGAEGLIARLHESLDRVESHQMAMLNKIEETYDHKAKRMRGVLTDLGLDGAKPPAATGGPFVAVKPQADASAFDRQLYRIGLARMHLDRLVRVFAAVPIRKPLSSELETSSGFGVRMDPFLRSPAMHTGIDFRASYGDPVRATAAGTVVSAGWSGGYGKMVEIDHGNGLITRYGHLSAIDVEEGQSIRTGQTVGRVGSTGRSTGPHLHYETRVDGEAVDPQKFLRAALRIGSI